MKKYQFDTFARLLATVACVAAVSSLAAIRTVTNFDDSGPGTLRDTIAASASGDTINFLPAIGVVTISLTSGELVIDKGLTIVGNGADNLAIDGGGLGRVFRIAHNQSGLIVNISGLTIRDGNGGSAGYINGGGGGILNEFNNRLTVSHCKFVSNVALEGGAVHNWGRLVVSNCTFSLGLARNGGAIRNDNVALIRNSSFWSNLATNGGAIYNAANCTNENCTFNANSVQAGIPPNRSYGGAICSLGALGYSQIVIRSCTISGNAARGEISYGGGVAVGTNGSFAFLDHAIIQNTIVERNSAEFAGRNVLVVYWANGSLTSEGYNFIGTTEGSVGWTTNDLIGSESAPLVAGLGPLQDNGGPTPTMAWLPFSFGIDRGHRGSVSTDQRGRPRPYDGNIANSVGGDGSDIGAHEVQPPRIIAQPSPTNQFVPAGTNVMLDVVALADSTPYNLLSYGWARHGFVIPGATDAIFNLTNVQPATGGLYSVTVRDSGFNYTESSVVNLSVGFSLNQNVSGNGITQASPSAALYNNNALVILTATPAAGWTFSHWTGDTNGTQNPVSVVMNSHKTVTASFIQLPTLTTSVSGIGTVSRNPDLPYYAFNESVALTATPAPGWVFRNWSGNINAAINPVSVMMSTNKTVVANFYQPTLTLLVNGAGWVMANPGPSPYPVNTPVSVTAVPVVGWAFAGWSGGASGANNPLQLVITNDMVVTAAFTSSIPDLIIDNTYATFTGSWATDAGNVGEGFFAEDFRYATATASANSTAIFRPNIPFTGNYDVFVWFPRLIQGGRRCNDAQHLVTYQGGSDLIGLNQNGGYERWYPLKFATRFSAGTNGFVRIWNQSTDSGAYIPADAIRWVWSSNQVVQPYIMGITRDASAATVTWRSAPGQSYRLQFKTNLTDSTWLNVGGDVIATGSSANKTDNSLENASTRFYRIELLP